ncbi:DEAD/DEAH box helicase [Kineococcus radiotolerans]|uniref:DEAD/DEAH box helicase domain protein n=1 Tax=Kineococcus radiotolerans (strain ATCC BAA-149 / DSM 14245 / SRS30216) TaxID=266940 RepID=A6W4C5_KINRD|nr:DEAD/DEAH box helicase [Kineococcus radiotolerans]ABS01664.1 DEAD/DEAH box helicase domain protein [Kineococcus radiotolerans SRS30216 = ATCC BAA-149]
MTATPAPATATPHLPDLLPPPGTDDPDGVYEAFSTWVTSRGIELYPAQQDALIEVVAGSNVVLATPTGSGKSLVAAGAHAAALSAGIRSFYTAPLKALVSEKFFALVETFGAERVGMMTGDASVNPGAPIVCCTAEVLANVALRSGAFADVGQVVMDEFHFYADPDRGWAWQVPLVELPQAQFLLMSATLGDTTALREDLTRRTGRATASVTSVERPVPLHYSYATTPLQETVEELLHTDRAPVYVVHSTQAAAVEQAQSLTSAKIATREQRDAIGEALGGFRFAAGFGKVLNRLLRMGVGVHHAGMLPKYRRLVETLAQAGLLKVICGTDTLGVGINVPIRTVLFAGLTKFDGRRNRHYRVREFHQIAGRAGRAGFDTAGTVVVQAPEHEVENARRVARAGDDPKKLKRVQRVKAPEGFVSWSQQTMDKLVAGEPEQLTSHFRVTTSMLLNVLQRPGNPVEAMRHLLLQNHEPRKNQLKHVRRAVELFRALLDAGIVETLPEPLPDGRQVRLVGDLQLDFALNQPLSPFALAVIDELLDPASPTYALDVVSVIESTLDEPMKVLLAQRSKAKGDAVQRMKADGVEYEERMELLEDVEWPQPLAEELRAAYETYRAGNPWVGDYEVKPKSVVRDMYERAMTFGDYVQHYQLARSEGLVLRYLSDAYKALKQTVPDDARTEELTDLVEWLGEVVRQTDSSLLAEWEALRDGVDPADVQDAVVREEEAPPVTANTRAFRVLVRNAVFRFVELCALDRPAALAELEGSPDESTWADQLDAYYEEHDSIGTGPDARGPHLLQVDDGSGPEPKGSARRWYVRQVLEDPAGDRDWAIVAEVDLDASDEAGTAVLQVAGLLRL